MYRTILGIKFSTVSSVMKIIDGRGDINMYLETKLDNVGCINLVQDGKNGKAFFYMIMNPCIP
jgi:hypothetical protein